MEKTEMKVILNTFTYIYLWTGYISVWREYRQKFVFQYNKYLNIIGAYAEK